MTIPKQTATMLPLALLVPHPNNVRKSIGDVSELAASIRQNGLVQPIVVTQHPSRAGRYLILAGHRRYAAATRIDMKQVPCIIRHEVGHMADHLQLMLVENVQRTQLSPVEKAEAIQELMSFGLTQADVARATGMHPATVNTLTLILELDEDSLDAVRAGDLTVGEAQAAVRKQRAASRQESGSATRGRPVQVEPLHFTRRHPLAPAAKEACTHSTRKKVGGIACGQCWEDLIRRDALGESVGGGSPMPPLRKNVRRVDVDEVVVRRRIDGDRNVRLNYAERHAAVELLAPRGMSDAQIADLLGITSTGVFRIRERHRIESRVTT